MTQNKNQRKGSTIRATYASTMRDTGFKIVYSNEHNMLLLINAILGEGFATEVEFINKEMLSEQMTGKRSYLDMRCRTSKGEDIVVEVQVEKQKHFTERMAFYSSYIIQDQFNKFKMKKRMEEQNLQRNSRGKYTEEGKGNVLFDPAADDKYVGGFAYEMKPTYLISILGFTPERIEERGIALNEDIVRYFDIRDRKSSELYTDCIHFVTIEVEKFSKSVGELNSLQDKILYSFKYMATENEMPDIFKGTDMEKIYEKAQIASFTDKEYNEYVSEIMNEEDNRNRLATAYNDGKADGRAEGLVEAAKGMLKQGIDVNLIAKSTGLSQEKILALDK